jgi:zinc protease
MPRLALRPPALVALLCGFVLASAPPLAAQGSTAVQVPKVSLTDYTLSNGLRVLMHEDHSSPIVAVNLFYNAGSKFDPKGKSGLAHMFEHMMDEGTLNLPPGEYKRIVQSDGGYYNAGTGNDDAHYVTRVQSNRLETVLWLEAERMSNLGPTLDSARFNIEREAVKNEYRQVVLNDFQQLAGVATFATLFPAGAYAPPLFGYPADIASATVDDLRRFYDTYYVPNNAVLVIVGDFKTADAKAMVQRQLGVVPRGKAVKFPVSVTPFSGEKRIVVEHQSGNRGLWTVWRGGKSSSADRPALLALSTILNQRLRRIFTDERRVGTISPYSLSFDLQDAGVFQVATIPAATASATMMEDVIDSVVTSVKTNGVTEAEVRRWAASFATQTLVDMQSVMTIASDIGDGAVNAKNPLVFFDLVGLATRVTPAQVQAAAKKYLTGDRVVVSIIPIGKFDLVSKPNLPYTNATPK